MTQVDSLVPAAHHPNFVVPLLDPSRSAMKMSCGQPGLVLLNMRQNTEAVQRVPALQASSYALDHILRDGILQPLPGLFPIQEQVPAVSPETQTQHRQSQSPSLQGNTRHPSVGLVCPLWCVSMAIACTICTWHRYNKALPAFSYAAVRFF